MTLCRFGEGRLGLVEGSFVRDITSALDVLPAYRYPLPSQDVLIANLDRVIQSIPAQSPKPYVAGYAIGLDITIRGTEDRSFRKSPDSYTVLGPWLVTADEIPNPGHLDLGITVNGEVRQKSNTKHMILGVPELIELASSFYTLHPGDIISTGTPEGVSPIVPGDTIVATIEKIGTMEVRVR
jgi:2-keto-4-pentenoate hydratase/2-oxohepta-3-ene-1,7-dioic acid hydratase in catechol pathway